MIPCVHGRALAAASPQRRNARVGDGVRLPSPPRRGCWRPAPGEFERLQRHKVDCFSASCIEFFRLVFPGRYPSARRGLHEKVVGFAVLHGQIKEFSRKGLPFFSGQGHFFPCLFEAGPANGQAGHHLGEASGDRGAQGGAEPPGVALEEPSSSRKSSMERDAISFIGKTSSRPVFGRHTPLSCKRRGPGIPRYYRP